jgi:hydrogenase nickel incorporation protein HypB
MCTSCGCGTQESGERQQRAQPRYFPRKGAAASPASATMRRVAVEQDLLARNDAIAQANRDALARHGTLALNLVSSPGSGKTTLLVKTIASLRGAVPVAVIEGDQQTSRDAERILAAGAPAIQVNTGKGCHLDARQVAQALAQLPLAMGGVLMIENVGNLVCPAAFDLGEACKVVIFSVTEGEDKPLKYPDMFRAASLMLISKCDLLPHLQFDLAQAIGFARRVNPQIEIIEISSLSGQGMEPWLAWITRRLARGAQRTTATAAA